MGVKLHSVSHKPTVLVYKLKAGWPNGYLTVHIVLSVQQGWFECVQHETDNRETQDSTLARHPAVVMVTKHLPVNWMKSVLVAMVTAGVKKRKGVRENKKFKTAAIPGFHIPEKSYSFILLVIFLHYYYY